MVVLVLVVVFVEGVGVGVCFGGGTCLGVVCFGGEGFGEGFGLSTGFGEVNTKAGELVVVLGSVIGGRVSVCISTLTICFTGGVFVVVSISIAFGCVLVSAGLVVGGFCFLRSAYCSTNVVVLL